MKTCYTRRHQIPFYIDDEDFNEVAKHAWCANGSGYLSTNMFGKLVSLHRLLMGFPIGLEIDHVDGNRRNNCRNNMRICTRRQNQLNRKSRPASSSKYKGVSWNSKNRKWIAFINWRGKGEYLGSFSKEEDAAKAYNAEAVEHFGRFARLNVIL